MKSRSARKTRKSFRWNSCCSPLADACCSSVHQWFIIRVSASIFSSTASFVFSVLSAVFLLPILAPTLLPAELSRRCLTVVWLEPSWCNSRRMLLCWKEEEFFSNFNTHCWPYHWWDAPHRPSHSSAPEVLSSWLGYGNRCSRWVWGLVVAWAQCPPGELSPIGECKIHTQIPVDFGFHLQ